MSSTTEGLEVVLESRYYDIKTVAHLKKLSGKTAIWRIKTNSISTRSGMDEKGNITFFDPEGGPFVSIGTAIPRLGTVTKIYHQKVNKNKALFVESKLP